MTVIGVLDTVDELEPAEELISDTIFELENEFAVLDPAEDEAVEDERLVIVVRGETIGNLVDGLEVVDDILLEVEAVKTEL